MLCNYPENCFNYDANEVNIRKFTQTSGVCRLIPDILMIINLLWLFYLFPGENKCFSNVAFSVKQQLCKYKYPYKRYLKLANRTRRIYYSMASLCLNPTRYAATIIASRLTHWYYLSTGLFLVWSCIAV